MRTATHLLNGILTQSLATFEKVIYRCNLCNCMSVVVLYLNGVKAKFNQCCLFRSSPHILLFSKNLKMLLQNMLEYNPLASVCYKDL